MSGSHRKTRPVSANKHSKETNDNKRIQRIGRKSNVGFTTKKFTLKKIFTVSASQKFFYYFSYRTPAHFDYGDLERKYWKNITYVPPIYGADVSGSLTDPEVDVSL